MSLLSWLFPKAKPSAARAPAAPAAAPQPARPASGAAAGASGPPRTDERMQRREQLYAVVRDVMVRAGVLSAGYKFKVLSLDARGAQFLVMVDMAPEYSGEPLRGVDIEALIVQTAKTRCDIVVTAVYWRVNAQLGAQLPQRGAAVASGPAPQPIVAPTRPSEPLRPPAGGTPSRPAPLARAEPSPSRPAPLVPPARPTARFEPIEPDEVAAFKRALASAAVSRAPAPAADLGAGTRSGPLLPPTTGFEDTLVPGEESGKADLSSTQYGDL